MRTPLQKSLCIGAFLVSCISLHAQTNVHGVVRDGNTKDPIAFASVSLLGTTLGTAADAGGRFAIVVSNDVNEIALNVSAIGYYSKRMTISNSTEVVVELDAAVTELEGIEITTQRITPEEVIKEAMASIEKNYPQKPFNMEFYSRIEVENPLTQQEFTVETIALGYYTGYASSATKKFELIHQRRAGKDPLKAIAYPYWPTLEMHRADLLADPARTGIFNPKLIDKFDLAYEGLTVFDNDTVFQISYSAPRPTKQLTGYGITPQYYRGKIYITTSSFAIVKHVVETDAFLYTIIYRKLEDRYFPYFISGDRRTKATQPHRITNSISLRSVTLENVRTIGQSNEFQDEGVLEDPTFWNLNYPVRD